jgi:hypothetical protein
MSRTSLGGVAVVALIWALPASAQVRIPEGASIKFSGRVHSQFNSTSVASESSTEFLNRRARLSAEFTLNEHVSGKVEPDYGGGKIALKDAFLRLSLRPELQLRFGQFKRPFDIFELTSSSRTLVVERDGEIRGVDTCAGIGGVCSLSRFTEELQYSDRDIGVTVEGRLGGGRVGYAASVMNGTGANKNDENGNKSFTGRLDVEVAPSVVLAAHVGTHDYIHLTSGADRFATAFGGDLVIGNFSRGLHIRAGVAAGDNWLIPVGTEDAASFVTTQGIVSYRQPTRGIVQAVEPVGRVSWGDPDTDTADDAGFLITPGFIIYLGGRSRIAVNLDVWSPSQGDTEYSFKAQTYFHF